jgi:hypothetical protein
MDLIFPNSGFFSINMSGRSIKLSSAECFTNNTKEQNLPNKNKFFLPPNRYSLLKSKEIITNETPSNTKTTQAEVISENSNNDVIQSQSTENNPKII